MPATIHARPTDPSGAVMVGAIVKVRLLTNALGLPDQPVFDADGNQVLGVYEIRVDASGWSLELPRQSELSIDGTVWEIETQQYNADALIAYVSIPDGAGPFEVADILTDAPATVESSALALHAATSSAHVAAWDAAKVYATGDRAAFGGTLWESLADDNTANVPEEGASWTVFIGASVDLFTVTPVDNITQETVQLALEEGFNPHYTAVTTDVSMTIVGYQNVDSWPNDGGEESFHPTLIAQEDVDELTGLGFDFGSPYVAAVHHDAVFTGRQVPEDLSQPLLAWLRSDRGRNVQNTAWTDQVNDPVNVATSHPTWWQDTGNGVEAYQWGNTYSTWNVGVIPQPFHLVMGVRQDVAGDNWDPIGTMDSDVCGISSDGATDGYTMKGQSVESGVAAAPLGELVCLDAYFDGANSYIRVNNGAKVLFPGMTSNGLNALYIGSGYYNYGCHSISEVAIFDNELSAQDITDLNAWVLNTAEQTPAYDDPAIDAVAGDTITVVKDNGATSQDITFYGLSDEDLGGYARFGTKWSPDPRAYIYAGNFTWHYIISASVLDRVAKWHETNELVADTAVDTLNTAQGYASTAEQQAINAAGQQLEAHTDLSLNMHAHTYGDGGFFGLAARQAGGGEHMVESWPISVNGGLVELDILESGKMVGSAAYINKDGDYNCINIGLGSRQPVNMTQFWVAVYEIYGTAYDSGPYFGPLLAQSTIFYPPIGGVTDPDASQIDPSLSGGFLELYLRATANSLNPPAVGGYTASLRLNAGMRVMCFIGCVADVTPTVMGLPAHKGLEATYPPYLAAAPADMGLTTTPPAVPAWSPAPYGNWGGSAIGERMDHRFYWRIEDPSGAPG